ncbi:aminoacyl-histidine dipeptidase [bacterium]|nr:aminoacyl-histidine dipeptidase [candidate division CSSED10-310 bacterium]
MSVLEKLEPKGVWRQFEAICSIPHPSRHEEKLAEYIIHYASKLGFDTRRDDVGNVVVDVPATRGMEEKPTVVLQGHLDMVPVAAKGVSHDFETDPIRPYIDGDYVKARGTTLGADNGIGVAMMLAIMEDPNVSHGPLELFFTINEESGMDGAHGLKPDFLKGRILLNLDTEEWGEYYISCAGGGDSIISLPIFRESADNNDIIMTLSVSGLKGGHSGMDINCGRGSGNKIIGRCLASAAESAAFRLYSIRGGNKRNSIADGAEAIVSVPEDEAEKFQAAIYKTAETIVSEYEKTDPDLEIETVKGGLEDKSLQPMTKESTKKIVDMLVILPHGVIAMSPEVPNLVETSTNIGVMSSTQDVFTTTLLTRSAVTSQLEAIKFHIKTIARLLGADVEEPRGYPGWKPDMDSQLLKLAKKVFVELHGYEPKVKAIHAGLECGLFSEKLPGVDMISLGPEMHHVHSPAEELNIPSVPKTYHLLTAILKSI